MILVALVAVVYMALAFVSLELNPLLWNEGTRIAFAAIVVVLCLFVAILFTAGGNDFTSS